MNISENVAFQLTRQRPMNVQLWALWLDLTQQADKNTQRHIDGRRVKLTKFVVVNANGYYVNVILSPKNNILVRSKVYNEFEQLREAIENIND